MAPPKTNRSKKGGDGTGKSDGSVREKAGCRGTAGGRVGKSTAVKGRRTVTAAASARISGQTTGRARGDSTRRQPGRVSAVARSAAVANGPSHQLFRRTTLRSRQANTAASFDPETILKDTRTVTGRKRAAATADPGLAGEIPAIAGKRPTSEGDEAADSSPKKPKNLKKATKPRKSNNIKRSKKTNNKNNAKDTEKPTNPCVFFANRLDSLEEKHRTSCDWNRDHSLAAQGQRLSPDRIWRAIASVTEAISRNESSIAFSLVNYNAWTSALAESTTTGARSITQRARPGREAFILRDDNDHMSLLRLRPRDADPRSITADHYDCGSTGHVHRDVDGDYASRIGRALDRLEGISAADPRLITIANPSTTYPQDEAWQSDFWAILSAWAVALGYNLRRNITISTDDNASFWPIVARLVNLALVGRLDSETIDAFLRCHGLIDRRRNRQQDRQFRCTIPFRDDRVMARVVTQRRLEDELPNLIEQHQLDHRPSINQILVRTRWNIDDVGPISTQELFDRYLSISAEAEAQPNKSHASRAKPTSEEPSKPDEGQTQPSQPSSTVGADAQVSTPCDRWEQLRLQMNAVQETSQFLPISDPPVRGEQLQEDTVWRAIASVTEAISHNGHGIGFSLVDTASWSLSRNHGSDDPGQLIARPGREMLIPRVGGLHGEDDGHSSLYVVESTAAGYRLRHYDTANGRYAHRFHQHAEYAQSIRKGLDAGSWRRYDGNMQLPSTNELGNHRGRQHHSWECGYYVTLFAWAHALGLDFSGFRRVPDSRLQQFFDDVPLILTLSLNGVLSSEAIEAFLKCYGIVLPSSSVAHARSFEQTQPLRVEDQFAEYVTAVRIESDLEHMGLTDLPSGLALVRFAEDYGIQIGRNGTKTLLDQYKAHTSTQLAQFGPGPRTPPRQVTSTSHEQTSEASRRAEALAAGISQEELGTQAAIDQDIRNRNLRQLQHEQNETSLLQSRGAGSSDQSSDGETQQELMQQYGTQQEATPQDTTRQDITQQHETQHSDARQDTTHNHAHGDRPEDVHGAGVFNTRRVRNPCALLADRLQGWSQLFHGAERSEKMKKPGQLAFSANSDYPAPWGTVLRATAAVTEAIATTSTEARLPAQYRSGVITYGMFFCRPAGSSSGWWHDVRVLIPLLHGIYDSLLTLRWVGDEESGHYEFELFDSGSNDLRARNHRDITAGYLGEIRAALAQAGLRNMEAIPPPAVPINAAEREEFWQTTVYSILFAWARALGLDIIAGERVSLDDERLSSALKVINLAQRGFMDHETIEALLKCLGIVHQDQRIPNACRFVSTFPSQYLVNVDVELQRMRGYDLAVPANWLALREGLPPAIVEDGEDAVPWFMLTVERLLYWCRFRAAEDNVDNPHQSIDSQTPLDPHRANGFISSSKRKRSQSDDTDETDDENSSPGKKSPRSTKPYKDSHRSDDDSNYDGPSGGGGGVSAATGQVHPEGKSSERQQATPQRRQNTRIPPRHDRMTVGAVEQYTSSSSIRDERSLDQHLSESTQTSYSRESSDGSHHNFALGAQALQNPQEQGASHDAGGAQIQGLETGPTVQGNPAVSRISDSTESTPVQFSNAGEASLDVQHAGNGGEDTVEGEDNDIGTTPVRTPPVHQTSTANKNQALADQPDAQIHRTPSIELPTINRGLRTPHNRDFGPEVDNHIHNLNVASCLRTSPSDRRGENTEITGPFPVPTITNPGHDNVTNLLGLSEDEGEPETTRMEKTSAPITSSFELFHDTGTSNSTPRTRTFPTAGEDSDTHLPQDQPHHWHPSDHTPTAQNVKHEDTIQNADETPLHLATDDEEADSLFDGHEDSGDRARGAQTSTSPMTVMISPTGLHLPATPTRLAATSVGAFGPPHLPGLRLSYHEENGERDIRSNWSAGEWGSADGVEDDGDEPPVDCPQCDGPYVAD